MAEVLNLVAIREQEHAAAFTKRICELEYHVRQKSSERFVEHLKLAESNAGDRKKFEVILGYGADSEPEDDQFGKLFDDESIDPHTAQGWLTSMETEAAQLDDIPDMAHLDFDRADTLAEYTQDMAYENEFIKEIGLDIEMYLELVLGKDWRTFASDRTKHLEVELAEFNEAQKQQTNLSN